MSKLYDEVPQEFMHNGVNFELVKEYNNHALYRDKETGFKECFPIRTINEGHVKYSAANQRKVMIIDTPDRKGENL